MTKEGYEKYTKPLREERKSKGLCRCGGVPIIPSNKCQECLDKELDRRVRRRYGLDLFTYRSYFINAKCWICRTTDNLELDHDHKTGKIRGVLCHSCNTGIGGFRDSIQLLAKAIEYLSK